MVGAVVFDMDGVILDSEQLVVRSWQKIAGKYGIENIEGFCMAALGLNREAAKKLFVRMYDGRYGDEERYEVLKAEMASEFHRAAADGELVPENAFAVEDSYNGVRAAHSAGMKVVMIPDLVQPDAEMREKALIIFDNMDGFKEYIMKLVTA